MRLKVLLSAFTMIAALGGWATTQAADRDDYYPYGDSYYYYHPDRDHAYDNRHYPDRSDRSDAYYYRDGRRYSYSDEQRQRYRDDYDNRADRYGIDRHDTN